MPVEREAETVTLKDPKNLHAFIFSFMKLEQPVSRNRCIKALVSTLFTRFLIGLLIRTKNMDTCIKPSYSSSIATKNKCDLKTVHFHL